MTFQVQRTLGVVPNPTQDLEIANKHYVDTHIPPQTTTIFRLWGLRRKWDFDPGGNRIYFKPTVVPNVDDDAEGLVRMDGSSPTASEYFFLPFPNWVRLNFYIPGYTRPDYVFAQRSVDPYRGTFGPWEEIASGRNGNWIPISGHNWGYPYRYQVRAQGDWDFTQHDASIIMDFTLHGETGRNYTGMDQDMKRKVDMADWDKELGLQW